MSIKNFLKLSLITSLISACGIASNFTPTVDPNALMTQAFSTVNAAYTQTALAIPTATSTPTPAPLVFTSPLGLSTVLKDITYCTNEIPLKMDIYYPKSGAAPWPILVYIHGGVWMVASKDTGVGLQDMPALLGAGYAVALIEYREAPEYPFPGMIIDAKCAVRFLRAHSAELMLDPDHMGAWGTSSGGHLVSLLGLADESAGWDTGQYLDQSSRLQAVIEMFGPADFMDADFIEKMSTIGNWILFNEKHPTDDVRRWASPVTYVSPDDPCFFIVQGEKDTVVEPQQANALYRALTAASVPSTLLVVLNSAHNFAPSGGAISPSRDDIRKLMISFFDTCLRPGLQTPTPGIQ